MIIARDVSEHGETILRYGNAGYEVIVNGQFLMSSASGGSSTALVELGMAGISGRKAIKVLIAGLGLGFSLKAALRYENVVAVTVIELSAAIIDWHYRDMIAGANRIITDSRVTVLNQDFIRYVEGCNERFDLIAVDIDNGPEWLTYEPNAVLYTAGYLGGIRQNLTPGGVATFWSADRSSKLRLILCGIFNTVTEMVYNDHNGEGRVIPAYIYKAM